MSAKPRICGVILSAGASNRMGRDKALLPWPSAAPDSSSATSGTLLSATIAALKPFTEAVVVVAGMNADNLASVVAANGAAMVRNPEPERGQFSSMQIGLREVLARGCDAAMITLVDCPPLSVVNMEKLSAAFEDALVKGIWGVAPEHDGKRGHPLVAGRELISAFLAAPVTSNAREVKRAYAQRLVSVPVSDSLLSVDVNTPEEYAGLASCFPPFAKSAKDGAH